MIIRVYRCTVVAGKEANSGNSPLAKATPACANSWANRVLC